MSSETVYVVMFSRAIKAPTAAAAAAIARDLVQSGVVPAQCYGPRGREEISFDPLAGAKGMPE